MSYVDGFVLAVPTANKQAYIELARQAGAVLKEYGALQLMECWGDDVPDGEVTSFPMAVKCASDETVCFSWILWPSRAVRDVGMKEAMADPRLDMSANTTPFDVKRMIYGGFEAVVDV